MNDSTTYAPCPACDSTEHLQEAFWYGPDGRWLGIECTACKLSAPASLWPDLPRVTDPDDGERL